jgi:hypothetical protein
VRHGEVHNPDKVLYGRLPDFHLSERGRAQAQASADWLADNDIVYVVASPLERAQETAEPIAAPHGLTIDTDDDLIESWNHFEGEKVAPGDGALRPMPRSRRGCRRRCIGPAPARKATRPCASAISFPWRRCAGR